MSSKREKAELQKLRLTEVLFDKLYYFLSCQWILYSFSKHKWLGKYLCYCFLFCRLSVFIWPLSWVFRFQCYFVNPLGATVSIIKLGQFNLSFLFESLLQWSLATQIYISKGGLMAKQLKLGGCNLYSLFQYVRTSIH